MGLLDGKVAFITGAGDGQGRTTALVFEAEGATVVGCDREIDLTDSAQAKAWIDDGVRQAGAIDILCNTALALRFASIETMTQEDWDYTMRNELDVVFNPCQAAWPHLQRDGGSIVNMASVSGLRGVRAEPQFAHGAAKAGVMGMTRHLAAEGAPHGIRVNAISPGLVATPINAALADPDSEMSQVVKTLVPIGRAGSMEEIARAAVFLASDASSYITGTELVVDGGLSSIL